MTFEHFLGIYLTLLMLYIVYKFVVLCHIISRV